MWKKWIAGDKAREDRNEGTKERRNVRTVSPLVFLGAALSEMTGSI
jgi:hypothetical protein